MARSTAIRTSTRRRLLARVAESAVAPERLLRGTDLRCGGVCRVDRDRSDGGTQRGPTCLKARKPLTWPRPTAHGSLAAYISGANPDNYQPANITFDLLPPLPTEEASPVPPRQKGAPPPAVRARA